MPKNISKEEEKALEELVQAQKRREIIIKPVDKGGGIMIANHDDYVQACEKELASKTLKGESHYREIQNTLPEPASKL